MDLIFHEDAENDFSMKNGIYPLDNLFIIISLNN
jgi:hypothetical protein